jgi:hypothetical protein
MPISGRRRRRTPGSTSHACGEPARPAGHFPGGHRRGVTPVPIPNTEVKLSTADGTAWVTVWESRSLPGLFLERPLSKDGGLLLVRSVVGLPRSAAFRFLDGSLVQRYRYRRERLRPRRANAVSRAAASGGGAPLAVRNVTAGIIS